MNKKPLLGLALIALLGCHRSPHTRNLRFTIAHDSTAQIATVTCTASSSGKCHFALTGNISPATADLEQGDTFVFHGVTSDTEYCAEVHQLSLDSCKKYTLPLFQSTESRESRTDGLGN